MIIIFYVISYLSIALAFGILLLLVSKKFGFGFKADEDTISISIFWPIMLPLSLIAFVIYLSLKLFKKIEEEINKLP